MKNQSEIAQKARMELAISLDKTLIPDKPDWNPQAASARRILLNLIGMGIGKIISLLPVKYANAATEFFSRSQAQNKPLLLDDQWAKNWQDAQEKIARHNPAILILTSHPKSLGPEAPLLGSLIQASLKCAQELGGRQLKIMQAIDAFALDTLDPTTAALYEGIISTAHIGVDRMPWLRSETQKLFFHRAHYLRVFANILRQLRSGYAVFAALGGAISHNARVFYTIREFATRLIREEKVRELKFVLEEKIRAALQTQDFLTGQLTKESSEKLKQVLVELKISESRAATLEKSFAEEMCLTTPWRARFFRVLQRRWKGPQPLLLIPLYHTSEMKIGMGRPRLLEKTPAPESTIQQFVKQLH